MLNKTKDNVIMRVYQPTKPFSEDHIPKKLVSGVIRKGQFKNATHTKKI